MPIRVQVVGHGIVEFPDGTSQDEMQKALSSLSAPPPPKTTDEPSTLKKVTDAAANVLPAVGGIIGGVVGGPAGAAAGGAAGEGYRQLAQHITEIPGAIKDVASNLISHPVATAEGVVQGTNRGGLNTGAEATMQAGGQVAGDLAAAYFGKPIAKWLMNRATSRVSEKLLREFPELSDTLIDNALSVSKGGYGKAYGMLMEAKSKANAAIKTAEAAGATIPVQMTGDLGESLKTALLERLVKAGKVPAAQQGQPLTAATARLDASTKALFADIDAAATKGGALDLTPTQADALKTQLQKESRALYANRTAPNGQKAVGMDATERADFATQLNNAIDGLASGYKAANAEAKPLIGAVRGIKQATRQNGSVYQAMVRPAVGAALGSAAGAREGGSPGAAAGAIAGAYAGSPMGMSHAALILANPATAHLLSVLPKGAASYLISLLSTDQAAPSQSTGGSR